MKKFLILNINDPGWSEIISSSYEYDFYHTQSYSALEYPNELILLVAFEGEDFIALPLIIRKIARTVFYDCTSVYGYCGPVSNKPFEFLSGDHIRYFQDELLKYFKARHVVSVFSRLHPLINNQSGIFENFGIIREINSTVAIDLQMPEEQQLKNYRESHRRNIKKSLKEGYSVSEASTQEEIESFVEIYLESMKRLNTDSSYLFGKSYFNKLLNNSEFDTRLLLAKKNDVITGGGVFTITNKIMQYHLGAVGNYFIEDSPLKIVIDQARRIGNELKLDYLHLGGGFSGKSNDSLFYFKSGFSDIRLTFSSWQMIIDEDKYSYLADLFNVNTQEVNGYFPAYRVRKTISVN